MKRQGFFNKDIYVVNNRYPLDTGEYYTKEEIDSMFTLAYPAGTKLVLWNDGTKIDPHNAWYLEDGDGGWNDSGDFVKENITIGKQKL